MSDWKITFLNIGQGDATHIQLPDGSNIFIDTGPDVKYANALAWWVKEHKHSEIRSVVVTHNHIDHFGGLASMIGNPVVKIGEVFINYDQAFDKKSDYEDFWNLYTKLLQKKAAGETKVTLAKAGMIIYSDGNLELSVLGPNQISHPCDLDPNETSLILGLFRVGAPDKPIIIWGGDARLADVLQTIGATAPQILMGPHHASPQDLKSSGVYSRISSVNCPGCVFASLGGKYVNQPKRDYVTTVNKFHGCWCCSQVSKQCKVFEDGKLKERNVYNGSALIGVKIPSGKYECRGSMRVRVSSEGVLYYDKHQERFLNRVKELVPERHCNK